MPIATNDTFQQVLAYLAQAGGATEARTLGTPEHQAFLNAFPLETLASISMQSYCVGKGDGASFCWWIERGLQPVLGRYSPGTSKGHILYYLSDGTVYKNRHLAQLSDEEALRYTLKIQATIAAADPTQDVRWIDDDQQIYTRARVSPMVTVGDGRKLRLLACYHPEAVLPISSSDHIKHFLMKLGCAEADIPAKSRPVARMMLLWEYYQLARESVPGCTPRGFMKALYSPQMGLAPVKEDDDTLPLDGDADPLHVSEPTSAGALQMPSLNQILFGPPGTGKTYETVDAALSILDPDFLREHMQDRARLKERFDAFAKSERIRFVTFHQSFSYEDFVEGLRAQSNESGAIDYPVEDGIFKKLCDAARTWASRQQSPEIVGNPRIWKISIDGTGPSPIRQYCLSHGEARIGWGNTGDLKASTKNSAYLDSLGSNDRNTLQAFSEEITVGDILVCIASATEIGAVGVVTGPYSYDHAASPQLEDRRHVLPVNWLYSGLKVPILPLNDNKQFTLKTVYPLDRFGWGDLLAHLENSGAQPVKAAADVQTHREPHVLIIDEINRGNISRIFGELITLIEPSKREGKAESLSVQLPYSKRPFSVPDNVYLIGTMNTADRSLAGMDIALRRRFDFIEKPPRPELLDHVVVEGVNVGTLLRVMNERIEVLLDRDHCLGHAYFMTLLDPQNATLSELARIFRTNILPLLQEYFFEDWQRIAWVLNDHSKPKEHCFLTKPKTNASVLFGDGVPVNEQRLRWAVNDKAFAVPEAYAGVISIAGADNQ